MYYYFIFILIFKKKKNYLLSLGLSFLYFLRKMYDKTVNEQVFCESLSKENKDDNLKS